MRSDKEPFTVLYAEKILHIINAEFMCSYDA